MKTHTIAPRSKNWIRRLLADEQGTATTETVIMIPMFVIVWGCIVYVTQVFQATIEMRSRIRRDTWAYAYNSCEDMPDTGTTLSTSPGFIPDSTGAGSDAEGAASGGGGVISILGAVSTIMSYIPGLNFESLEGSRSDFRVERPAVIGGGSMSMGADLTILCNEQPQGVISMLVDAVSSAFGF